MKNIITTILISVLTIPIINAQNTKGNGNAEFYGNINKDIYISKQLGVYTHNPSLLYKWTHGEFTSMSLNGDLRDGNLKTIDMGDEVKKFDFTVESVQEAKEKKFVFYGKFTYGMEYSDDMIWNMFYERPANKSPFRIIVPRNGEWQSKRYRLTGAFSKEINDKWSIGGRVNYFGDLNFRMRDTRNKDYNLTIDFMTTASYQFAENRYFTFGAGYYYTKREPEMTNNYSQGNDPADYFLYTTDGLGNFSKHEMVNFLTIQDINPQFTAGIYIKEKNEFSVNYVFYKGKETWKYKSASFRNNEDSDKLYKYDYYRNTVDASYQIHGDVSEWLNFFKFKSIVGESFNESNNNMKTYMCNNMNFDYSLYLLRSYNNMFYKSIFQAEYDYDYRKDMQYAHKIEYSNLKFKLGTGFKINFGGTSCMTFDVAGSYRYNLDYTHDVAVAGSKPYTQNLAYNEVAYSTADYLKLDGDVRFNFKIKNIHTELSLGYSRMTTQDLKIENEFSVLTDDDKRNTLRARINLIF